MAEAFAERVLDREQEIPPSRSSSVTALATERAKAAVATNAEDSAAASPTVSVCSRRSTRRRCRSRSAALEQISGTDGEQVPTLAEVEPNRARLGAAGTELTSADPIDLQIWRSSGPSAAPAHGTDSRRSHALGLAAPIIDVASVERRELEP